LNRQEHERTVWQNGDVLTLTTVGTYIYH